MHLAIFITYIAYEGEGRDGYRDQIVTCDVGVSLHSKIHPLFMKYSNGTSTQCHAYIPLSELVSCAFSTIPICPFLIQRIFRLLVSTLFLLVFMFTYCVLLATVLTAVATVSSPQFSYMILPVGSGSCTRFELSLTELRNVRDTYSVASYVGQSHGKNACNSCLLKVVSVLGCFLAAYISWITDGPLGAGPG